MQIMLLDDAAAVSSVLACRLTIPGLSMPKRISAVHLRTGFAAEMRSVVIMQQGCTDFKGRPGRKPSCYMLNFMCSTTA